MTALKTLAFEIGTEEIPAFDLKNAVNQLKKMVPEAMGGLNIPFGEVAIYSSPRRLIVIVKDVADATEAIDEVFRGPAAKIAFDADGNPTKAAIGFARGKGLSVDDLERRDENGTEYVFATRHVDAKNTIDLLPEVLKGLITGLSWPRSCRWACNRELFTRPVRWIVALLGDEIVPVEFAGLKASRQTMGHRVLAPGFHEVATADDLIDVVRSAKVVPSQAEREAIIRAGVAEAEKTTGLSCEMDPKTLTEVINLSEYPTVLVAQFDELFLKVPEEIIVDSMLSNQRYFPLYDKDHKLSNKFIVVSNGDPAFADNIIDGNQRVVAARLYDAKFFYDEDLKKPLEAYVPKLDTVVFQEELGTVLEKTHRVTALAKHLAIDAGLSDTDAADAERAAYLAKADLVTSAVIEFTSVQGIMGSYYATAAGETDQVAQAIADHYKPRFSGDNPPASKVGCVVAMADKLDTICGLFAIGQGPTGSSDPFALRRSAIGIVSILGELDGVSLVGAIDSSLNTLAKSVSFDIDETRAQVIDFFIARTKVIAKDRGNSQDAIEAVLAANVEEPIEILRRVAALESARSNQPEAFEDLATAFARASNLADAKAGTKYDTDALTDVQRSLSDAVIEAESQVAHALEEGDYAAALDCLASLRAPIDEFFENVMVMDDDLAVRATNMQLLNRFTAVFANVADMSQLVKK